MLFLFVTTPNYTAQAKIFIETQKAKFIQQQSMFADAPIDISQMESQIQILQSKAVVASVVEKLKLADDPEFANPSIGLIGRVFQSVFTAAEPDLDAREAAIATLMDRLTINRVGLSLLIEINARAR